MAKTGNTMGNGKYGVGEQSRRNSYERTGSSYKSKVPRAWGDYNDMQRQGGIISAKQTQQENDK